MAVHRGETSDLLIARAGESRETVAFLLRDKTEHMFADCSRGSDRRSASFCIHLSNLSEISTGVKRNKTRPLGKRGALMRRDTGKAERGGGRRHSEKHFSP